MLSQQVATIVVEIAEEAEGNSIFSMSTSLLNFQHLTWTELRLLQTASFFSFYPL